MKEPEFSWDDGRAVPYSQARAEWLRHVDDGTFKREPGSDRDFRRRCAAILLQERGQ